MNKEAEGAVHIHMFIGMPPRPCMGGYDFDERDIFSYSIVVTILFSSSRGYFFDHQGRGAEYLYRIGREPGLFYPHIRGAGIFSQ